MGITASWTITYGKGIITKGSLVEFIKMAQKKASNFQNGGKQPVLNDISSRSSNHKHFLTEQKILNPSITSHLLLTNCWKTAFPNHNCLWSWIQIHWTAWFSVIHCWPKKWKCDQHPHFYIWTTVSCSTSKNFHHQKQFTTDFTQPYLQAIHQIDTKYLAPFLYCIGIWRFVVNIYSFVVQIVFLDKDHVSIFFISLLIFF